MAVEAVGGLLVLVVAAIGSDDAGVAPGADQFVALQPLPVKIGMRLVDEEAAGLLVVIGERDAVALDILAGLIGARTEIACQRDRAGPRLDPVGTLEELAGQAEAMGLDRKSVV